MTTSNRVLLSIMAFVLFIMFTILIVIRCSVPDSKISETKKEIKPEISMKSTNDLSNEEKSILDNSDDKAFLANIQNQILDIKKSGNIDQDFALNLSTGKMKIVFTDKLKDKFIIHIINNLNDQVDLSITDKKLKISLKDLKFKSNMTNKGLFVYLMLPDNLNRLDIDTNAGQFDFAGTKVNIKDIRFTGNAGQVNFNAGDLITDDSRFIMNAGQIKLNFNKIDMTDRFRCELNAGQLILETGTITGNGENIDFKSSAGESRITIKKITDYTLEGKASLGSVVLNGEDYKMKSFDKRSGNGKYKINFDINLGKGIIDLNN